ncbi:MAG: DUF362 domain-containing protein [Prevotellaceae bacterium]|jgi:hypothetical protein|nr:DUF362 domain-containing protein [Prevotellaceae bacterium]
MTKKSTLAAIFAILVGTFCFSTVACAQEKSKSEKSEVRQVKLVLKSNEPLGVAHGIMPARVAWAHMPETAKWNGADKNWYDDEFNNQENCDKMMSLVLQCVANETSDEGAWKMLFADFNKSHGNNHAEYVVGQQVAIKINMNNTYSHDDSEEINASPQMVLALLRSLVYKAGVPQECISLLEPSRFITDYMYKKVAAEFPKIRVVDNSGGDGREKSTYVENAILYSADNGHLARGLAIEFVKADYVINMALLKGHTGQGVTLCGKNWYGATNIHHNWRHNAHDNFDQNRDGSPRYMTFVDFMGHKDLGGKTLLYLIDGLYGSRDVAGRPSGKWNMTPFNGNYPNSLFASQDGVAIDAVGIDFICAEFPNAADVDYSDAYLVEAATADNPASKTVYDPERDGTPLKSLGVVEHWNNVNDKLYNRNLEKKEGIELIYINANHGLGSSITAFRHFCNF